MTRGKYASTSEARRARENAEAEVVRLRRELEIASLTIATMRREADERVAAHRERINQSAEHIEAGTSIKLMEANRRIFELQREVADLKLISKEQARMFHNASDFISDHFHAEHGYSGHEVLRLLRERVSRVGITIEAQARTIAAEGRTSGAASSSFTSAGKRELRRIKNG